jgi:hypothetical protein
MAQSKQILAPSPREMEQPLSQTLLEHIPHLPSSLIPENPLNSTGRSQSSHEAIPSGVCDDAATDAQDIDLENGALLLDIGFVCAITANGLVR